MPLIDAAHEFHCMCTMVVSISLMPKGFHKRLLLPSGGHKRCPGRQQSPPDCSADPPTAGLSYWACSAWSWRCCTTMLNTQSGWITSYFKPFRLKKEKSLYGFFSHFFTPYPTPVVLLGISLLSRHVFWFFTQGDKAHKPWFQPCKSESCPCFPSGNTCNLKKINIFLFGWIMSILGTDRAFKIRFWVPWEVWKGWIPKRQIAWH